MAGMVRGSDETPDFAFIRSAMLILCHYPLIIQRAVIQRAGVISSFELIIRNHWRI